MRRGKLTEGVLGSSKKQTYNQARLEDVYRSMNMTATYQPKAMLSTTFNNRKGDKRLVASANRYSAKRNGPIANSGQLKESTTSKSLNERVAQSAENLNEEKNLVTEPLDTEEKDEKSQSKRPDGPTKELKLEDLEPTKEATKNNETNPD